MIFSAEDIMFISTKNLQ